METGKLAVLRSFHNSHSEYELQKQQSKGSLAVFLIPVTSPLNLPINETANGYLIRCAGAEDPSSGDRYGSQRLRLHLLDICVIFCDYARNV